MTVAVVMAAVLTSGPTGCLLIVSTPPLQPKNVQSREKAPANHGARGETATMSFVPGANREGKERVKGKASRIQSSRIDPFNDWGGGGDVINFPPFGRKRHENSPYRGHI